MTLRHLHAALAAWRPARLSDLERIARLAAQVHPDHPERPAVFADRFTLHPSGVLLAEIDGTPVGYAVGHPWHGPAPVPDRCLDALPPMSDAYWIHDVALLEAARGRRLGRAALFLLRADATRCRLRLLRLVAVGDAVPFWRHAGFAPASSATAVDAPPGCYGDGAIALQQGVDDG